MVQLLLLNLSNEATREVEVVVATALPHLILLALVMVVVVAAMRVEVEVEVKVKVKTSTLEVSAVKNVCVLMITVTVVVVQVEMKVKVNLMTYAIEVVAVENVCLLIYDLFFLLCHEHLIRELCQNEKLDPPMCPLQRYNWTFHPFPCLRMFARQSYQSGFPYVAGTYKKASALRRLGSTFPQLEL